MANAVRIKGIEYWD